MRRSGWQCYSENNALRGNAALDAPRPLVGRGAYASAGDAERHGLAPTLSVGAISERRADRGG